MCFHWNSIGYISLSVHKVGATTLFFLSQGFYFFVCFYSIAFVVVFCCLCVNMTVRNASLQDGLSVHPSNGRYVRYDFTLAVFRLVSNDRQMRFDSLLCYSVLCYSFVCSSICLQIRYLQRHSPDASLSDRVCYFVPCFSHVFFCWQILNWKRLELWSRLIVFPFHLRLHFFFWALSVWNFLVGWLQHFL